MKKCWTTAWYTGLSAIFCYSAHLHGGAREVLLQELTMNHFANVSDTHFMDDHSSEGIVVKIEAGTKIPLKMNVNGSVISLQQETLPAVLVIHKTFYIKALPLEATGCTYCGTEETAAVQPQFLFSQDKASWYNFEEFFGGMLHTSLVLDEVTSTPIAEISIDVEFKQQ
jgi:hypothetical protein